MSTAYSSAKQQYIGNGVTTEWGFDFPIKKHSELKVYLKRSTSPQVLLEEGVDYSFVTENTIAFPIKTGEAKLQATDVLALQRESVFESEYNFSNQQRLEPEEVMHADDNLERQIQELKRDSESAIKVLPTSNVDPNMFFEQVDRVYGSVDNIDTVANDKANVDAVAGNITNVNKTAGSIDSVNAVAPSISSVNTVATNISSVNTAASNMAAIKYAPTAAANAAQSAANAANSAIASANSATASAASANNSHIWAEGTDEQVQALGGVHSSKVWAEQSTNANIALTNSPYTTNRILEIPQDIKLELNNGTLTLKAGSKVYVPNGPGAFVKKTTSSDLTLTNGWGNQQFFVYLDINNTLCMREVNFTESGSNSSLTLQYRCWYDTTNNSIKWTDDTGSTWREGFSFPIALITADASSIISIDQVFNGFGYIGSTVFALPGVKVQIPDGRNDDGSCKNRFYTETSVKTFTTYVEWSAGVLHGYIGDLTEYGGSQYDFFPAIDSVTKLSEKNLYFDTVTGRYNSWCPVVSFYQDSTGKITSFTPFTVDSVLNSSLSNLSPAGEAKFDAKANVSNTVTTDTAQTIGGSKRFTQPPEGMSIELTADTNQQTVPTAGTLRQLALYKNNTHTKGDGYTSWLQAVRGSDGWTATEMYARRFLESDSQEIINYIRVNVTPGGVPISYTKIPPIASGGEEIVTAGWFNSKMQVVSALPANPDPNVFYFIPE